ncbi:MAG: ion channel, partial [Acidimicrobiia bacterium]|nr:ion channel [Acidimicrobiia bacterium]
MDKPADPWRQVRRGIGALLGVLIAGTVAYSLLGLAPFDAFYQTLITITTVGYTEVGDNIGPS